MNREEFIEEINYKYNYCEENKDLLTGLAQEKLLNVFFQMDKLDELSLEQLDDVHEEIMFSFCALEDLGL